MTHQDHGEQQTPRINDTSYVRRSVSLFPAQDATVTAFAMDSGLQNYSAALRMIINQWLRYETKKRQADLPEPDLRKTLDVLEGTPDGQ